MLDSPGWVVLFVLGKFPSLLTHPGCADKWLSFFPIVGQIAIGFVMFFFFLSSSDSLCL